MCGGLKRQSGIRLALPACHHESMSCPTLAPTELVYACSVQVLFPSRRAGIAPSPLISFFCIGGPACSWDCVLLMHVAGHPEESNTLLRLMVVASSRLLLVLEGVGLMPVLSMFSFLSTECL